MIGDIIISLARKRKDKIDGTGRFHIMTQITQVIHIGNYFKKVMRFH